MSFREVEKLLSVAAAHGLLEAQQLLENILKSRSLPWMTAATPMSVQPCLLLHSATPPSPCWMSSLQELESFTGHSISFANLLILLLRLRGQVYASHVLLLLLLHLLPSLPLLKTTGKVRWRRSIAFKAIQMESIWIFLKNSHHCCTTSSANAKLDPNIDLRCCLHVCATFHALLRHCDNWSWLRLYHCKSAWHACMIYLYWKWQWFNKKYKWCSHLTAIVPYQHYHCHASSGEK